MSANPVAAFCQTLSDYDLIDSVKAAEVQQLAAWQADVRALARELIQRDLLTLWQVQTIMKGRAQDLVLGSYLLLEQIGEGGMGKVFKARHRMMGRVVALKIIRKERLTRPEAVRRFQREIQAVAQLSHPNVIMAFDAAQLDDVHFFAMEYVEGIDLHRLVQKKGPLPVPEACEYIRQAATGLQHAFERGLVHRDLKPSNLFLTMARAEALRAGLGGALSIASPGNATANSSGVIKILDLGLARLQETGTGEALSRITLEGKVLGTPDFIAPEQVRNSSAADIRADLYGLGCTLFFLLSGRPPFPAASGPEVVVRHATEPPPSIALIRNDVPPPVDAIIRKLLAKQPDQRYQSPAQLAFALEPFGLEKSPTPGSGRFRPLLAAVATPTPSDRSTDSAFRVPMLTQQRLAEQRQRMERPRRSRVPWWTWVLAVLALLVGIAGLIGLIV